MPFIYSYPAPRVMAAHTAAERFEKQLICENFQTDFVQLWAVSYECSGDDDSDGSDDILTLACADVNEDHGLGDIVEMPRSEFEALVPLATLFNTPSDIAELAKLPEAFFETDCMETNDDDVVEEAVEEVTPMSEGEQLGRRWRAGQEPLFDTFEYLRQGLPLVPAHLAADYVEVCRLIQFGEHDNETVERIATMCDAMARVIEPWMHTNFDGHS